MTKNSSFGRKFQIWFWGIFSFLWVLLIGFFVMIGLELFGPLPSFEQLENPKSNIASEVFTEDHVPLVPYYIQLRTPVSYDDLSPNIVNALLSTEDIRFHNHSGIDARGIARVMVKTIILGQSRSGGGSTITQQLAKNLFPRDTTIYRNSLARNSKLVVTKLKEWITAVKLERNYTKEEIIAMYLNTVAFGSNAFGVRAAAKTFFNTTPDSLSVEQAALLVGVVNAPTRYSPIRNPERSLQRRNFVVSQMAKYGYITDTKRDSIWQHPIELNFRVQDHNQGLATYFREHLRLVLSKDKPNPRSYYSYAQYKEDSIQWENDPLFGWCNKNVKPDGTPYNLYRDGLKIYTTINSRMQQYAEEAVAEHLGEYLQPEFNYEQKQNDYRLFNKDLSNEQIDGILLNGMRQTQRYRGLRNNGATTKEINENFNQAVPMTIFTWQGERDTVLTPMDSIKYYKRILRTGFMAMNPRTGHIKAWVGGPNFKHFKYDHVKQGKRQVGSTIKPFLYTLAMQEGYSPCDLVPNVSQSFVVNDSTWTPRNSGRSEYEGKMVTLKWGLANSINNISAWLMKRFNPYALAEVAQRMGITSHIDPVVSAFLGTSELSVYEMVSAYATYPNKGVHNEPLLVTRIEDKNGNILATFQPQRNEAISDQTAYLMINLLEGVVNQGTAGRLRWRYNLPGHIAGKTGTTNNHSDGWFMGIVPNLVGGVWVGAEDRSVGFENIAQGQGANMALPIFGIFMQKVFEDGHLGVNPTDEWDKPLKLFDVNLDCEGVVSTMKEEESFENDFF
ncbi:MAG TPA: transglycosylase domain-containing protein [Perlabentimonas sp.]|nr:transglycosylase domain-containing protein [Bacteroidales bacterium]MDD4672395.1 transglycosylase domain-containing protein [Bacteroidales bacterium]MDY0347468.1 transglycosylase domain-containing protein [Tenuifilaceae bacterium]HZJ73469.1 transglycosylase domain-containing protein [Perlabentimonas sp.]